MSVPEFMDNFVQEEMNMEVHIVNRFSHNRMVYIGSPTNFDAFAKHMKLFKDTDVFSVYVNNGKLIVCAV